MTLSLAVTKAPWTLCIPASIKHTNTNVWPQLSRWTGPIVVLVQVEWTCTYEYLLLNIFRLLFARHPLCSGHLKRINTRRSRAKLALTTSSLSPFEHLDGLNRKLQVFRFEDDATPVLSFIRARQCLRLWRRNGRRSVQEIRHDEGISSWFLILL